MTFFFLLLSLSLIYIRPQDFSGWAISGRLVLVVMILLVASWAAFDFSQKKTKLLEVTTDYWVLALAAAAIFSTVKVHYLSFTLATFVEFSKLAIFYFMTSFVVNNQHRMSVFIRAITILTTVVCFIACLQPFGIDLFRAGMVGENRIQGIGIFNNPNYLAYSAVFSMPFAFGLLFRTKGLGNRILGLFSMSVFLWAVILTKSRGGMLCFILTLFFLLGQNKKKTIRLLINSFSVLMILIIISNGFGRMRSLFNIQADQSIVDRADIWYVGLTMLRESPFVGIGYNQFSEYYWRDTHSSFVRVGTETGLIGLFCWIGLIYFLFKRTRWLINNSSLPKSFTMGAEGTLVAFLITSFFATMGFRVTLFIIAGFIAAAQRFELAKPDSDIQKSRLLTNKGLQLKEFFGIGLATAATLFLWKLLTKAIL